MNYQESLKYLDSFVNFEVASVRSPGLEWNLVRMRWLLDLFDHPENNFLPILIAGTKGKGSTGFFFQSILNAAGIRTGFYCSPHLETPLERIRILGQQVSARVWSQHLAAIKVRLSRSKIPESLGRPTYFEILTLLAALIFKSKSVRVAIFEVGLGGRFDATNAFDAPVVILTTMGMDHEAVLGGTLAKISAEKAAVIRRGAHVILSPQLPDAEKVILAHTSQQKAIVWKSRLETRFPLGLKGTFQKINAGTAVKAAEVFQRYFGFRIDQKALELGLRASHWPGRIEIIGKHPRWIIDGAHNPAACRAFCESLAAENICSQDAILIFGTSRDKKAVLMLDELARFFKTVIVTKAVSTRAQDVGTLLALAGSRFETAIPAANCKQAMELAGKLSKGKKTIVITGSFFLIGEARTLIMKRGFDGAN